MDTLMADNMTLDERLQKMKIDPKEYKRYDLPHTRAPTGVKL